MPGPGTDEEEEPEVQYLPQAILPIQAVPDVAENLQLAISNRQYPVTPGDVYTLTFLLAGETVSNTLLVESDYNINMTIFGELNAAGMTFAELKPVIEKRIADAYPRSLPSVTITSVGVFQIPIRGEIPESRYVTAWGLSRLSQVLDENLGIYSSVRDVEIISGDGSVTKYDLLMALNQGILEQNPTIKPDETIVINRIHREIQVLGEVYKPGVYQLLDQEDINDVLRFTGGFTPLASTSRIKVDRYTNGQPSSFSMSNNEFLYEFQFHHGDIITIPSIIRTQPVVFVEGGVSVSEERLITDAGEYVDEYDRIVHTLNEGETLYDILDSLREYILPFADLENGFVIREGEPIPVNMQNLLYRYELATDIELKPFDHVNIPLQRPVVYVTGAANNPGSFSYTPQQDYIYYVNRAGGFDELRNRNKRVIVTDKEGKSRDYNDPILPGDTVNVISNDFLYNFNQYFPAIATGLGLILTIITITNALNQTSAVE